MSGNNITGEVLIKSILKDKKNRTKNTVSVCFDNEVKAKLEELSIKHEFSISYIVNEFLRRIIL